MFEYVDLSKPMRFSKSVGLIIIIIITIIMWRQHLYHESLDDLHRNLTAVLKAWGLK